MTLVYSFSTTETPKLNQVGGKAMSLIKMTQHGLPVPPGFVLSLDFFEPWLQTIKNSEPWQAVISQGLKNLKQNCTAAKALCKQLSLNTAQQTAFNTAVKALQNNHAVTLFAVRSSSPEEDLEGASFAGGYYELPKQVYAQLKTLATNTDKAHNPQAIYDKSLADRQKAYRFLLMVAQSKGRRAEKKFKKQYNILETFGAYREIHKYYFIWLTDMVRKRVLAIAQQLLETGQLERIEQIFELKLADVEAALANPSLDLKAIISKNTAYYQKINQVRNFPRVIDSRGRILQPPPRQAVEGEFSNSKLENLLKKGDK